MNPYRQSQTKKARLIVSQAGLLSVSIDRELPGGDEADDLLQLLPAAESVSHLLELFQVVQCDALATTESSTSRDRRNTSRRPPGDCGGSVWRLLVFQPRHLSGRDVHVELRLDDRHDLAGGGRQAAVEDRPDRICFRHGTLLTRRSRGRGRTGRRDFFIAGRWRSRGSFWFVSQCGFV